MSQKIEYRCTDCGATGVRLWRVYMGFAFGNPLTCRTCSEKSQGRELKDGSDKIGYLVPAVPTEDGSTFWGYTSVPEGGVKWWYNLPVDKADAYGPLGIDDWN